MTRRYLSLHLTNLAIDRLRLKAGRQGGALPEPLALYAAAATGDELYAYLETDYDTDGFSFSIEEGAPMRLEVYLDGYSEPRFVYWVSGGILQRGAPSNPVDFLP